MKDVAADNHEGDKRPELTHIAEPILLHGEGER